MPKLVCVPCHTELKPETSGTLVVENASFGPYKVWNADTWKCPVCGHEVVAGFANAPIMEHYEMGFEEMLAEAKMRSKRVEYDYELSALRSQSQ